MRKTAIQISQEVQAITEMFMAIEDSHKVTKVGANSVLNSLFFGIAKAGQRINKDVIISQMKLLPDTAFGSELDGIAEREGLPGRFSATESSTYLYVHGAVGSQYLKDTNFPVSIDGKEFKFENDFVIPAIGYTYQKVRSKDLGVENNIDPFKIVKISPAPVGHIALYNEYFVEGGSDNENDEDFRNRIKIGVNILATDTLSKYEQIFRTINNRVLKIYKGGFDETTGKYIIYLSTINGIDLTSGVGSELEEIEIKSLPYFSFSEQERGVSLRNIPYTPIDIEMRVELNTLETDKARIEIQKAFQKKYDFRYWTFENTISWLELFIIAKNSSFVNKILEKYFIVRVETSGGIDNYNLSNSEIVIPSYTLPRFRSFRVFDLNGNIISDTQGVLNPLYFPNELNRIYQQTLLQGL
jgi:hypothetical protein